MRQRRMPPIDIPRSWYELAATELNAALWLDPPIDLDSSDEDLLKAVKAAGKVVENPGTHEDENYPFMLTTWICIGGYESVLFEVKTLAQMKPHRRYNNGITMYEDIKMINTWEELKRRIPEGYTCAGDCANCWWYNTKVQDVWPPCEPPHSPVFPKHTE